MVLQNDKQNQQTSSQAHQKGKWDDPNKVRNERGEITNTAEIQKKKREYYEQLKLDNLEDIDKFLETYSPPKLNQEETDGSWRQDGGVEWLELTF